MLRHRGGDDGQLTLLIIGFVSLALALITVGVDASKVFLARRALSSVADSAALAGTQALDRDAIYSGAAGGCGGLLPLDPAVAQQKAEAAVDDDLDDLHHTFSDLGDPETSVAAGIVSVHLGGDVTLPFGRVLGFLDPGLRDGRVHVDVTAHAQSPLTTPGGC